MSNKQLKTKVKQRQGLRLNAQKEIAKIQPILSGQVELDTGQIQVSINKLKEYQKNINVMDDMIAELIEDDAELDAEINKTVELNEMLLEGLAKANQLVIDFKDAQRSQFNTSHLNVSSVSPQKVTTVKLPKLEIEKFAGESLKWQEFWDNFDSTIHNNDDLSPIDKLKYLRSFLEGDALRLADGYRLTAANYNAVISTLEERYGSKQMAIFAHFEAMLALPTANHELPQLRMVSDDCEKHIRSLVALGLQEDTFGQVFTPIMLSKLPKYVKMELHRKHGSQAWSLQKLRELMKDEIFARDMSERSFAAKKTQQDNGAAESSKRRNIPKNNARQASHQSTASSLVSAAHTKCGFCSENHFSDQCKKYPDVRARQQKSKGKCFNCLKSGHSARDCKRAGSCFYCKKQGHHRSLCFSKFSKKQTERQKESSLTSDSLNVEAEPFTPLNTTSSLLSHGERTMLETALAKVSNGKDGVKMESRLLFDTGCSRSYITVQMVAKAGLKATGEEIVSQAGFKSKERRTKRYETVEVCVHGLDGHVYELTVNVVPVITCPIQKFPIDTTKYPIVRQIVLAEPLVDKPKLVPIDILIGNEYYHDFVGTDRIRCSGGPLLISSSLGFIATGRIPTDQVCADKISTMILSDTIMDPLSHSNLERFWSLEDIGIKDKCCGSDDETAVDMFNKSVIFQNGRYQVTWPWKGNCTELLDNYKLAKGRFGSLLNRIQEQKPVYEAYSKTIADQESSGVIERAPKVPNSDKVYYMPHHCVITPQKTTTKLRIVYDASSKSRKDACSLNECLHRGPVMLEDLCGMLLRFRVCAIAMVSDIEKAFLQVGLQEQERDCTRFLWIKDPKLGITNDNLVIYRFCRVPFGVISSPFLLAATIPYHLRGLGTPTANDILQNTYVDNIMAGRSNVEDALVYYKEAKEHFRSASMNLREWYSNSSDFVSAVEIADRGKEETPKVLGLIWNVAKDTISSQSVKCSTGSVISKRHVLQSLAKVFDPCGLFSPIIIAGKMLIQKLWQKKYDWDDPLPSEIVAEWKKVQSSIELISTFEIPRFFTIIDESPDYRLHCFTDASGKAYAASVYLQTVTCGNIACNLVFAKSRVVPLKGMTIPRLELLAVLIGVRLLKFVQRELRVQIAKKILWTDSQCVLHWIKNPQVSTVFVRNRVNEIKQHTDVQFEFVLTAENPADIPSRGCEFKELSQSQTWRSGPEWLMKPDQSWPKHEIVFKSSHKEEEVHHVALLSNEGSEVEDCVITIENFSSLERLLRVTTYVLRFIHNARSQYKRRSQLTAWELGNAKTFWEKLIQAQHFLHLVTDKDIHKHSALQLQLNPFVGNDGLIRCHGRFEYAELNEEAKKPILLPKNSVYTDMVIMDCHKRLAHAGVEQTLAQTRHQYWIIHGRGQVKRVLSHCLVCRRVEGSHYSTPPTPPMPEFRSNQKPPFAVVGIDYLGPLFIKGTEGSQKVWICLFTCAVVMAIHLEVVQALTAEEFLMCFRRFVAIYGKPDLVISDNAKQFHAANITLEKLWREIQSSSLIQEFSSSQGITWKFIIELAPWMGGFYKRMIGLVKRALKKSLNYKQLSMVQLQTVVAEISATVISRPIVYVESDAGPLALTPCHFLARSSRFGIPTLPHLEDEYQPSQPSATSLILKWKRSEGVLNSFWKMWKDSYLLNLRERAGRAASQRTSGLHPSKGTVVLIKEHLVPRGKWDLGIISELFKSKDGQIRSASVRLASGKHINRSLKMLYPIEIGRGSDATHTSIVSQRTASSVGNQRPRRAAAKAAEARIKQLALDDSWTDEG